MKRKKEERQKRDNYLFLKLTAIIFFPPIHFIYSNPALIIPLPTPFPHQAGNKSYANSHIPSSPPLSSSAGLRKRIPIILPLEAVRRTQNGKKFSACGNGGEGGEGREGRRVEVRYAEKRGMGDMNTPASEALYLCDFDQLCICDVDNENGIRYQ